MTIKLGAKEPAECLALESSGAVAFTAASVSGVVLAFGIYLNIR